MRTTVTLDPDTEQLVRARMAARGQSFKQALNDAIRDGAGRRGPRADYSFPTYDLGATELDLDRALTIAGELEDAELVRRMQRGS